MTVPAQSLPFGPLRLRETYIYYEAPRLFCASSDTGQLFLGISVEEGEVSEVHLYVPMSEQRRVAVRSGLVSLRDAVLQSEAQLLAVRTTYDSDLGGEEWWWLSSGEVSPEWLPDPSAHLNLPTPTQDAFDGSELELRSSAQGRSLLGLRLPDRSLRTEYGARDVTALVRVFQDAASSMGQEIRGNPTSAGALPGDVLEQTELAILELQAASFVVILAPAIPPVGQLGFESPLAAQSLGRVMAVVEASDADDNLRQQVATLHRRAKKKLHDLFETIVDIGAPVTFALAQPAAAIRTHELSVSSARLGLAVLTDTSEDSEDLAPFPARIIGVNLRTKSFEVHRTVDGRRFSGGMEPAAVDMVQGKPIGEEHIYLVGIRRNISVDAVTGEETPKFRLLSIAEIEPLPDSLEP